jgi:hypothetical protein
MLKELDENLDAAPHGAPAFSRLLLGMSLLCFSPQSPARAPAPAPNRALSDASMPAPPQEPIMHVEECQRASSPLLTRGPRLPAFIYIRTEMVLMSGHTNTCSVCGGARTTSNMKEHHP